MNQKYDYSVIIGRFSSPHLGHKDLIDFALSQSKKVIILIGSANLPRTIKNPFKWTERQLMIESMYGTYQCTHDFRFRSLNDHPYNDQKWAMQVQNVIDEVIENDGGDPDSASVCLVGNNKDHSSWYLSIFPQFPLLTSPFKEMKNGEILSATSIRKILFESDTTQTMKKLEPYVHKGVLSYLKEFMKTDEYYSLVLEHRYIEKYKKSWEVAPYPVTYVTCDSLVVQSGHILLIKRKSEPGKNLLALPGGFLNQNELIVDGALRELHEETKLKVPVPVLKGNIKKQKVYDAVDRSFRGRTVTHAFLIELPDGELPRVKGSDDALKAFFMPLKDLRSEDFFEDHYSIITDMVGL